ncbi:hypothetical protein EVA_12174 [gut metagenome]|uniref:Uncharacterized protein n=1 Tax=gut metagenome TaxID=749906 RepID=J9GD74_9ZZZZ
MVAIVVSSAVTLAAKAAGTHSSTQAKAPAASNALASSIIFCAASMSLPCTLKPPS